MSGGLFDTKHTKRVASGGWVRYFCGVSDKLRAYLYLHFCVFLWGFTAILGKLISLNALPLVWWRVLICCATLWLWFPRKELLAVSKAQFRRLFGIGMLVGVHWLCFYGAIKLANASVAVATMATASFFSALTEPFFLRQRVKWYELLLGVLILPGMILIVGNLDWKMRLGFATGVLGAFLAAVFTALNKKEIEEQPPPAWAMTFAQLFAALCVTSLVLPFFAVTDPSGALLPVRWDWLWFFVLAWCCTLLPYYLTLKALRHLSAFATNLTINLEPVYGVVLAGFLFREDRELSPGFYTGVAIILLAVFSHPLLKKLFGKNEPVREPAP